MYFIEVKFFYTNFDNLSTYGLSREEWIADFRCPSGKFLIDEIGIKELDFDEIHQ
jgi:hypothetical protein